MKYLLVTNGLLERSVCITLIVFLLFSVSGGAGYANMEIPDYAGKPFLVLHENMPDFDPSMFGTEAFVSFSPLDRLGRTGIGFACLGRETIPTSSRGMTGNIRPSGWHTVRYDDLIEDKYLYNRSHVIGFLLSGDSSTPENLFTGTRYLNATSMLQYELKVARYIESSGNHVLYRVSPCYRGKDLVPFGVQMEAYSQEDHGKGICFNVFLYNVQPGILIDYSNGDSRRNTEKAETTSGWNTGKTETASEKEVTYVFNRNSKKFHIPSCSSVTEMRPKNRENFYGTREEALALGYQPCGACRP